MSNINTIKIVDYVMWIILGLLLVLILWITIFSKLLNFDTSSIPIEGIIDFNTTDRQFINGTLEQRGFPPVQCYNGDKLTYCQSVKRRFPTFRVGLNQSYYITKLVIYNHPEPDKRQLTPLMIIIENEQRVPVFKHLLEENENEPYIITVNNINTRGQYILLQITSMKAISFRMSDMEIYFKI